jgi:beta-N-acetylhexosaminidase
MTGDFAYIGKRFIFGLEGKTVSPFMESCIKEAGLFGVILYNRNFDNMKELSALLESLVDLRDDLIICIDQEGGDKSRLKEGFPNHPSNKEMSKKFSASEIEEAYFKSALELGKMGFDMNLAPVCDLGIVGSYIEERAFSDNPDIVSQLAVSAMRGIQTAGLLSCAKHFVGLGGSIIDPMKNCPFSLVRA